MKVFAAGYPAWKKYAGAKTAPAVSIKKGTEEGSIDIAAFKKILKENPASIFLIDVRDPDEFQAGHLKTAVNIPVEELAARLEEISAYQEKPVFTICRTDRKSATAARILAQQGFADVHVVRMGMTDWNKQGYSTE